MLFIYLSSFISIKDQAHRVKPLAVKGGISEQLNLTIDERPNVDRKKRVGGCREAFRISCNYLLLAAS